jgi:hypothetical protein
VRHGIMVTLCCRCGQLHTQPGALNRWFRINGLEEQGTHSVALFSPGTNGPLFDRRQHEAHFGPRSGIRVSAPTYPTSWSRQIPIRSLWLAALHGYNSV